MTDHEKLLEIIRLHTELERLMQGFDSTKIRLESMKDKFDVLHKDAYHSLEVLDFDAATGSKWMRKTKAMARDRRDNKNLLELATDMNKIFLDCGRVPAISAKLRNAQKQCEQKAEHIRKQAVEGGNKYVGGL